MRAQVSRCKSDKNSGSRHCRAAGSCQRCFVVDLSIYRSILKSNCLSFFVMNRENFKQATKKYFWATQLQRNFAAVARYRRFVQFD